MTCINIDNYGPAMEHLDKCERLTVDTETTGLYPWQKDRACGIAIRGGGKSFYFPFRHVESSLPSEKMQDMQSLLCKSDVKYIGFNYGFDMDMMYQDGVEYAPVIRDVQTAAHLMNENEASGKLKSLADKYLGAGASEEDKKLDAVLKEKKLRKNEMWKLPPEQVSPYACKDVDITEGLHDFYTPYLESWGITELWYDLNDYQLAICEMQRHGVLLDLPLMDRYAEEATHKAEECMRVLHELAGFPINPNSPKQLQKWLKLKSTAAKVLEKMPNRPGVKELLDYRGWSRVNANYYRKFRQRLGEDGRLHANLNIVGTETGRLSGKDPPLHAIPRYSDTYRVKDVFIAREGCSIVEADYSQAEMRVASHFGQETRMAEKLKRGADIHSETAEETGIPRFAAKQLNFSVVYGIGPKTLSQNLNVSMKQAREFLNKYHASYPGFKRLYKSAESLARNRGYIRMFTGRMRHYNTKHAYPHKASSNLVQGTVGEILRVAILRIRKELGIDMWLTVHDSILFEIEDKRLDELLPEIKRIMEGTLWMTVPMKVDFKVGKSWGTAKEI